MNVRYPFLIPLVVMLLAGCAPLATPLAAEPAILPAEENEGTIIPTMESVTPDPVAQELVQQAKVQLSQKFGFSVEESVLFSVESVEWPDASLGCPQAGISYAQVVTPGLRILLEANGQVYTFHTDQTDRVILCMSRGPDEIFIPP